MRKYTLEKLLSFTDDTELLNIYKELESGKIPSTSYAHDFCRKVNKMVDNGELCITEGKYRHIYLPSLSKAVYKEMASRYATYLCNYKGPMFEAVQNGDADETRLCDWCSKEYEAYELTPTDLGMLCDKCITAIRSRGEQVTELA